MKKPEILAPAGSLDRLKIAIDFGADAVYIGGGRLNLRAFSDNFTNEEMAEGIKYCHDRGKKLYVTMNVFPRNHDLKGVEEYIKGLYDLGVDAIIVADPSIVAAAKTAAPNLEIHLSTQANITNWMATKFWYEQGVKRIVLARELTLKEITEINENTPEGCELEVFIHGSMCVAYSGRCLISNYMLGRDANKGICSNACRYKYYIVEETRPGEYYPIVEDDNGTYIMNSKDLCMIEHIPELMQAGAQSLKIEGRNKSEYYLALVVKAYRQAIDLYCEDPENYKLPKVLLDEMYKVSHREYHTGFFFNEPKHEGIIYKTNNHVREYDVVAIVHEYDEETQIATCKQRNKFSMGEKVEILSSNSDGGEFVVEEIYDLEGNKLESCPHPGMMCKVKIPYKVEKNSFIRKELV